MRDMQLDERRGRDRAWMETVDQPSDEESRASQISRKTLQKYLLLQIPGITLVGFLLVGLHAAELLSLLNAVAFFIGWCIKDAVMYRFVRTAYGPGPPHGTAALVGLRGVVVDDLAPAGSVRLGAEQWSARPVDGDSVLTRGTAVRVVSVDGFVVNVVDDGIT